jgi:hypothetical protein
LTQGKSERGSFMLLCKIYDRFLYHGCVARRVTMLDAFHARLEARDPAKSHFRSYRLNAGTDLLGNWFVDITFSRISTRGYSIRHVVTGATDAQNLASRTLKRRSTAKKRIGTGYPNSWNCMTRLAGYRSN